MKRTVATMALNPENHQTYFANILRPTLVSIHDVTPATLPKVYKIINFLEAYKVHSVTLLIVPGMKWSNGQITALKKLQDTGFELAGHGWQHRVDRFSTFSHQIHGLLISRKEAEHLSLPTDAIAGLIEKSYSWFQDAGLNPPSLYVPPAWALGAITRRQLRALPYRYYEHTFGVYDSLSDKTHPMSICGYMADTKLRSFFLRAVNKINRKLFFYPMRVAIHPDDLELALAVDLASCLQKYSCFCLYSEHFTNYKNTYDSLCTNP